MPKSIKIDLPDELSDRLEAAGIRANEAERIAIAALSEAVDRPDLRARWGFAVADVQNAADSGVDILSEEELDKARRDYAQSLPEPTIPTLPAPPPGRRSPWATLSFILGLLGFAAWFVILGTSAYGEMGADPQTRQMIHMVVGLSAILGLMINLGALVAGIVGLTQKAANRWMAVTGIVLNTLQITGMIVIIMLGISSAGQGSG